MPAKAPKRPTQTIRLGDAVRAVLEDYPRIYFACHVRHVRDYRLKQTLSARQASILDHLDEFEATSLTQLAQHMGVTLSTMSLAIDRLERLGYAYRDTDDRDGRRVALRLSEDGVRIKAMQKVLDPDLLRALLARLTQKERREALRGLALLAHAAEAATHARHAEAARWNRARGGSERIEDR